MYEIILIVGLPGSGKTYLANTLSNSNKIFDESIGNLNSLKNSCKISHCNSSAINNINKSSLHLSKLNSAIINNKKNLKIFRKYNLKLLKR